MFKQSQEDCAPHLPYPGNTILPVLILVNRRCRLGENELGIEIMTSDPTMLCVGCDGPNQNLEACVSRLEEGDSLLGKAQGMWRLGCQAVSLWEGKGENLGCQFDPVGQGHTM